MDVKIEIGNIVNRIKRLFWLHIKLYAVYDSANDADSTIITLKYTFLQNSITGNFMYLFIKYNSMAASPIAAIKSMTKTMAGLNPSSSII